MSKKHRSKSSGCVCVLTSVHRPFDTRIYEREAVTLANSGYQVILVATDTHAHQTAEGIHIIGIPKPKWRLSRVFNWFRFLKIALSLKSDIYHFHDPDLILIGLLIKLFSGKPVIYDCHEPYREAIEEKEWIPKLVRSLVGLTFEFVEHSLSIFFSRVIIASPGQQSHFPEATLIKNFPKLERFDLQKQPNRESAQLAYLGQLSIARGMTDLIEARQLLKDKAMKIVLMGHFADENTRLALAELEEKYQLHDCIEWLGIVPYEKGISLLTQSAIGVIPFRVMPALRLAIPTKMFEYMACGLPVIATDLPFVTPFIREANCGLIVPPEDPQALSEAIEFLLDHPEEAHRLGENGRQAVIENYNWAGEAQKLLNLYQFLLGEA